MQKIANMRRPVSTTSAIGVSARAIAVCRPPARNNEAARIDREGVVQMFDVTKQYVTTVDA